VGAAVQQNPIIGGAQDFKAFTRPGFPAAKHCPDARRQFPHAEGLDDIVIGSQVQPQHGIGFLLPGCDNDDGCLAFLAVGAQELVAVHFGHHDIEQNQVGRVVPGNY